MPRLFSVSVPQRTTATQDKNIAMKSSSTKRQATTRKGGGDLWVVLTT